jgi:hypothetical protein
MMIGIGTPRSQSKIPRPKLPSSCCVGAISEPAMNFEAPQFVPSEKSTFHACLLPISPVSGRWKTSAKSDPSSIASSRRSLLTSASGIRERGPGLKPKPTARLDALVYAGVDRVAALEPSAATIDGVPLHRRSSRTPLTRRQRARRQWARRPNANLREGVAPSLNAGFGYSCFGARFS